ncbi:MAG: hypothetical protein OXN94_02255 [Chloroflexota bacterium]|nr:hypothetical protein [Chloroflexota bacterium]MDE2856651.1 hypothetical protein [Chloroflexota bacterium]
MELTVLARVLFRRWWLVAAPVALSGALVIAGLIGQPAASAAGFNAQIRYSASQELNLPHPDGDYHHVWLASEYTVNAFTDWARSGSFRDEIVEWLADPGIDMSRLGIAADNARSVGLIYLSHSNSESLQKIAEAAMAVLGSRNQTYFPQLGGQPAQVTILDQPAITPAPPPLTNRMAPILRLGLGLFIGLVLAYLAEYLDLRIHHKDDLQKLGLHVLGAIPRHRR